MIFDVDGEPVEADLFHDGMTEANCGPIIKAKAPLQSCVPRRHPGAERQGFPPCFPP